MNYESWINTYAPVANHLDSNASFNGFLFETYGEEADYLKTVPANNIWTLRSGDGGTVITAGYGLVNRLGYFVTKTPWETGLELAVISEEVECSCYKEEGYVDSFGEVVDGDPACEECEGYGMVEVYA